MTSADDDSLTDKKQNINLFAENVDLTLVIYHLVKMGKKVRPKFL